MTDTWTTPEWKEKAAGFVKGKYCLWHGPSVTTNLVPHHPRYKNGKKIYYTHDQYMNLEDCEVLCSKCNFQESRGYRLCPSCKKGYYKPKKGYDALCWNCFKLTPFGQRVAEVNAQNPTPRTKRFLKRSPGGTNKSGLVGDDVDLQLRLQK